MGFIYCVNKIDVIIMKEEEWGNLECAHVASLPHGRKQGAVKDSIVEKSVIKLQKEKKNVLISNGTKTPLATPKKK